MKTIKIIILPVILLALGACKKDQNEVGTPVPPNEQELITTVTLHFYEKGNSANHVMASFKDIDGVGGEDATIDTIMLDTNTTYEVSIDLLDESKDPTEVITEEVKEEGAEHIFCFEPSQSDVNITITDTDGTHPIGLESEWVTGSSGSGTVKVTLKHQPDSVKDGTCAQGETDVEVDFNIVVK